MQITLTPALSDNYIFFLSSPETNQMAVVDPAEARPVFQRLEETGAELIAIFNTHHHYDHIGANQALLERFPDLQVYGSTVDRGRIPGQTVFLEEGSRVQFGSRVAEVFFVPGHTKGHIAYYFPPTNSEETGELFCGDTLFSGGCGRLFEGTPAQMVNSLGKLRQLPDNTRIWCAHEYTLKNLQFALTVDSDNPDLQQRYAEVEQIRQANQPTIPALLGTEKQTNPFLRWDDPQIQARIGHSDPVRTFGRLRGMKDQF